MELPLQQGWNRLILQIGEKDKNDFKGMFKCANRKEFLPTVKAGFENPGTH